MHQTSEICTHNYVMHISCTVCTDSECEEDLTIGGEDEAEDSWEKYILPENGHSVIIIQPGNIYSKVEFDFLKIHLISVHSLLYGI